MIRCLYVIILLLLLAACTDRDDAPQPSSVPEGMAEVRIALQGTLTASPTSSRSAGTVTRANEGFTKNSTLLDGKKTDPLEEGSTLWLLVEGTTDNEGYANITGSQTGENNYRTLKSYVVKGTGDLQSLYPCTVDNDGKVLNQEAAPLYLPFGEYTFRAMSPAKAFLNENGEPLSADELKAESVVFRQKVSNGDYLISNDERYTQTAVEPQKIEDTGTKVQLVELRPLINQTAQLKFTIDCDPDDVYVHSVELMPAGMTIHGLQDAYGNEDGKELWNWSPLVKDTLVAYPGKKDVEMTVRGSDKGVTQRSAREVVIETAVLPTDATSSSIIVIFNLEVNGIPTQYEMMLNLKIFRAAFSYHYKGKVTITEGITTITWQYVTWSADVGI